MGERFASRGTCFIWKHASGRETSIVLCLALSARAVVIFRIAASGFVNLSVSIYGLEDWGEVRKGLLGEGAGNGRPTTCSGLSWPMREWPYVVVHVYSCCCINIPYFAVDVRCVKGFLLYIIRHFYILMDSLLITIRDRTTEVSLGELVSLATCRMQLKAHSISCYIMHMSL